jgi:hypothetical protein
VRATVVDLIDFALGDVERLAADRKPDLVIRNDGHMHAMRMCLREFQVAVLSDARTR